MSVFDPEILQELSGISFGLCAGGAAIGWMLWLTGWWLHRFWIVLAATTLAGILGLVSGSTNGVQAVIGAVLLAIAAGVLALALVRLVAFAAGGAAACLVMQKLAPSMGNPPLIPFLVGGLLALYLFRLWTMTLTSFSGTVIMGYFGLSLAQQFGKLEAVTMARERADLLNLGCGILTLLGLLAQAIVERRRARFKQWREMWAPQLSLEQLGKLLENKSKPAKFRKAG
jgi:hypothetical protein